MRGWTTGVLAVVGFVGLAGTTGADVVLYSTGFESPTFTTGNLSGQGGWSQDTGSLSAIQVQTSVVKTGTQAVGLNASGQPNFTRAFHFDSYNTATNQYKGVSLAADVNVGTTGTRSEFRLAGFDSNGTSMGEAIVQSSGLLLLGVGGSAISTGITVSTGVWHHLETRFDFLNRRVNLYYDNSANPVGTLNMLATTSTGYGITALQVVPAGTGTNTTYVDNLTLTAVPEPSLWALAGLGGLALAARRFRRPAAA